MGWEKKNVRMATASAEQHPVAVQMIHCLQHVRHQTPSCWTVPDQGPKETRFFGSEAEKVPLKNTKKKVVFFFFAGGLFKVWIDHWIIYTYACFEARDNLGSTHPNLWVDLMVLKCIMVLYKATGNLQTKKTSIIFKNTHQWCIDFKSPQSPSLVKKPIQNIHI